MQQIAIRTPAKQVKTTEYNNLAGVDFSQEAANVDKNRSPYALNMISDNGKNPVKRNGWETMLQLEAPVHNVWFTRTNGEVYCLAHAGSKIYKIAENDGIYTAELLRTNVTSKKGCGFFFREGDNDGFYILTGGEYLVFDGITCKEVRDDAYVPTTIIARTQKGGGESYEDINLLSGKMCEKFTGDDTAKIYQ